MPMTHASLIEYAWLQYRTDEAFRDFTHDMLTGLGLAWQQLGVEACLKSPATGSGVPLARYVLERYEASQEKQPHCVC